MHRPFAEIGIVDKKKKKKQLYSAYTKLTSNSIPVGKLKVKGWKNYTLLTLIKK